MEEEKINQDAELPKIKKYKRQALPKSLTPEEFVRLIKAVPDHKIYKEFKVSCLLAYESGMRISEITNLKKEDFNLTQKSILIREGKMSKDRIVPLPKTWRSWMLDAIPIKKSNRSLERNFKRILKLAGLSDKYVFHSLRHGFAVRLIEKGVPMNQVQLFLGHSNLSTTSIYTKARPLDALKSYEDLF